MELETKRYRAFVSYAAEDLADAEKIVQRLRDLDAQPVWDRDNCGGWPFVEVIKKRIAHSHLFLPLLTPNSVHSPWVNHEIGFAVGRNVPVLPLSLGPLPTGMAGALHAEVGGRVEDLLPRVTRERLDQLVDGARSTGVFECADDSDARTAAIIAHCRELANLAFAKPKRLRHRAPFSSFSLPVSPDDPIWSRRYYGDSSRASLAKRVSLSEERRILEHHAMHYGCDLILYPTLRHLSKEAIDTRIEILRAFLERMHKTSAPVRVIFNEAALTGNLLIVGDGFCAESITPTAEGYLHTTLTSHAPTVLDRIEKYDRMFEALGNWMSADRAIAWLDDFQRQGN